MDHPWVTLDGNEAAASVAHRVSDLIAIYPITPSTPMGESADSWSAAGQPNLWGTVPLVVEMQSEGGAAGVLHGALQTGALATTFTASQGLLLMIPNMYKIAGELTPTVFHVAARALAAQGLSIFGDHSDVMAVRATGWALLASSTVQEAHDLALIAHAATFQARVPFIHFFDGYRTSHELNMVLPIPEETMRAMIDTEQLRAHRAHALSPDHPVIRGTAQNPDVYFQARESVNRYYMACPALVQQAMDRFATLTGRQYRLFEYHGAADAERLIILMGSAAETVRETVRALNNRGEKVGVLTVHLYRPFAIEPFIAALPATTRTIAVLDRTKEPGSAGEPLYLDVVAALSEGWPHASRPRVIGGRYGLSSKEFTPAMVKAIFDHLNETQPKQHFTIGIEDDLTNLSLAYDSRFSIEDPYTMCCIFWGLGADGTVGANKDSIKIFGEEPGIHAQGYFVYDSKKSGSITISHVRFGPNPIHAPYLISEAQFIACHQFSFLERIDMLRYAAPGATFLLNSPYAADLVWQQLPREVQQAIIEKQLRLYVIDANKVAHDQGMGGRINRIMQTCFFAIGSGVPQQQAIAKIKKSIEKTYGKRGLAVVRQNIAAIDQTLENLQQVVVPATATATNTRRAAVAVHAPAFVQEVLAPMLIGNGDTLPVSKLPADGSYPTATAQWEKRNIALEIPVWDADLCIQCGKCSLVCPHAVIRTKVYPATALADAPASFQSRAARFKEFPDLYYTLQVSPEDCTGCGLCVEACPVKDKRQVGRKAINMAAQPPLREQERANWEFFMRLPDMPHDQLNLGTIKNSQLMIPLFEFSGACSGCGETPYIKLLTQLFGDHTLIANATGCSSIYGGNLPTTPYTVNREGRGPAWANSLFEDNAEFGLGMRLTLDKQQEYAKELLRRNRELLGGELVDALLSTDQQHDMGISSQRQHVAQLKEQIAVLLRDHPEQPMLQQLASVADTLVRKSVWIIGGDGWAYDIGFGGLDHVLASGRNVKVLVLDTEVYSNTGGQSSKATPLGAVAKFAARGKATAKKDLGLLAMAYGNIYVARIAMGADDQQTLKAFLEAEAYDGPALIIAYSHCIAHGIDMRKGLEQQKLAVQSGVWPLYRYNPDLAEQAKTPLVLDSKPASIPLEQYAYNETRFRMLSLSDPQRAEELMQQAQAQIRLRRSALEQLAGTTTE
jgi:pyruvate-ferredoxin/flavodoxin oxidoreductase